MVVSIGSSSRTFPSLLLGLLLCAITLVVAEQVAFYKSVGGTHVDRARFKSCDILANRRQRQRPDIYPPILRIEHSDPEKLAPGYIFITPYESQNPGPYIFDNSGVWLRTPLRKRLYIFAQSGD